MNELDYGASDDFQKAAALVLKWANDGLKDGELRLASEGFFAKRKLSAIFQPSFSLLRKVLAPAAQHGTMIFKDKTLAEAYCRSLAEITDPVVSSLPEMDPKSRQLVLTSLGHMQQITVAVLTKRTHDEVWYGSTELADELRMMTAGQ